MNFFTGIPPTFRVGATGRAGWARDGPREDFDVDYDSGRASVKRLRVSALATPEMQRVPPGPWVRRVADHTFGFMRKEGPFAVIAGQRPGLARSHRPHN